MLGDILAGTYEKGMTSFSYMLVNELCVWPYHQAAIVLFLSASHTNLHHFFIRATSTMLPKDIEAFVTLNPDIADDLIKAYHQGGTLPILRRQSSTEEVEADWATQFRMIENELREFTSKLVEIK
jgi:hypothetical protein